MCAEIMHASAEGRGAHRAAGTAVAETELLHGLECSAVVAGLQAAAAPNMSPTSSDDSQSAYPRGEVHCTRHSWVPRLYKGVTSEQFEGWQVARPRHDH